MCQPPYKTPARAERSLRAFISRFPVQAGFLECWPFSGSLPDGYAKFGDGNAFGTGEIYSHRIVYRLVKGPIPDGYEIDHRCRLRNCVNPLHLEAVTHAENMRRRIVGPHKTACPAGHALDQANTYINPRTRKRHCRECMRAANRRLRASKH